jgi:HSP20 family molecular chaperone IbpA
MSEAVKVRENGSQAIQRGARRVVAPAVDVFENDHEILVVADVPGIPENGFEIQVENDKLTIETKRQPSPDTRALAREYEEFDFARSFRIPAGIDAAGISAETKHGTLVVRLPKAAAAKSRKIVVRPRSGD